MWLEIKCANEVKLLNSHMVSYVCKSNKNNNLIFFMTDKKEIHLDCDTDVECAALIQGVALALNGMDFIIGPNYVKPLKQSADEALYKYMRMKEYLNDRS